MSIKLTTSSLLAFTLCTILSDALANPVPIPSSNRIPGWPSYLAMGTVTNNAPSVGDALAKTPVDAIFKYAGNDGGGDPGVITGTETIEKTIAQARYIESHSADHHKVMPVLVVYTINGSGGIYTAAPDVLNEEFLRDHYINLIQYCLYMESQKDKDHPNPATIILNPDFMGVMQQSASQSPPLTPTTPVNVKTNLAAALHYLKLENQIPSFANNVKGYIQSINWIVKTFGADVPFGWQENLWAVGSANWLHNTPESGVPAIATQVSNYVRNEMGAYQGSWIPNFLVFDRYERDDLYVQPTQWLYKRSDWKNYLSFVAQVSKALGTPAIIWQIPGGHFLTLDDRSKLTLDHVATAPNFFFGDNSVMKNFPKNIRDDVLNAQLDPGAYGGSATKAGDYLMKDSDQDWGKSALETTVLNNIVAILWGGGSTTAVAPIGTNGDDGGWLANKMGQYYQGPMA